MQQPTQKPQYKTRINQYIRVPQVRVILADGSNGGVMDTKDALKLAQDQSLDLVEINHKSIPPVCRIINHGKMLYDEKKKAQAEKKKQQVQELKEVVIRYSTDVADLEHKLARCKDFLSENHRVKISCKFRGREISHPQVGRDKLIWILTQLGSLIVANPPILMEGKIMHSTVSPNKNIALNVKNTTAELGKENASQN